ncbi:unnamed protein product [Spirodela intermedia]|uniref:Uncharacterized protein n=1 Tax=Spirodela intermedia TaxID=51605 RepID=A0A7I8K660_SPIIN|nr:unnamed protein product [Spirodela intermedia]
MGRRVVSGGCHLAERKNGDFAALRRLWGACQGASSSGPHSKRRLFIASGTLSGALWRLSPDGEELDGGGAHVRDFILRSTQQEEALHRIWYALRRWRLVS